MKKKKLLYFVVLHYQAIDVTLNCVSSLKKISDEYCDIRIVIVDNCSPNKSGVDLLRTYYDDDKVSVVINEQNLGFANGNNVGFAIAKKNKADYIVLINNDTTIDDIDFAEKIDKIYIETCFGVLGPDVLSVKDGIHQNPVSGFNITMLEVNKRIIKALAILAANKIGFGQYLLKKKDRNKNYKNDYTQQYEVDSSFEKILHGSCLIFSREYIDRFEGLYDKTFMYLEENILAYFCIKNNIKMLYSPDIKIKHYRNISTIAATKSEKKQKKNGTEFFYKNYLASLLQLKGIIRGF